MDLIRGWVLRKRDHGRVVFLDLRTLEFPGRILQAVFKAGECSEDTLERAKRVPLESSVILEGELKESERAPEGIEILVRRFEILQESEEFPLGPKKHGVEALMKYRHLTVRLPKYQRIWLVRSMALKAFRDWFSEHGWHEVSPPIIVRTACEGGATLFKLDWFGQEAFLSQSAQLYLEALIFSLGKVWSLTPSFRAEKSRTRRHLAEFWHLEAEAAFTSFEGILEVQEELLSATIRRLLEDDTTTEVMKKLGADLRMLEVASEPGYERISYEEALELLKEKGIELEWGQDLGADEERVLASMFEKPFFVTHYPTEIKSFYVKESERSELCLSADLMLPGYGEVTTGGERETSVERMSERLRKEGIESLEEYEWYFDLRRYGSVQHSGFGLGIERFLAWALKLGHVRETLPFPRLAREKEFI